MTCRWFSMQYLWHSLFDFTLPLFWVSKLNNGLNKSCKIFSIDENTSQKGYQFISAFTSSNVSNIRLRIPEFNHTCWNDLVIGFPKSEYNVTPSKWSDMMILPYEYPLEAYRGFREHMIGHFSGEETLKHCEPDPKHPRVLVFFRNAVMRDIVNKEELVGAIKQWCRECRVEGFLYQNETIAEQMSIICNASILISIHGSQLSHMVWMKIDDKYKKSSVIEILPYGYDCRNWYEQIANGAEIKYFKWMNTNRSNTRSGRSPTSRYEKCLNKEFDCLSCHDLLRDQPTIVVMKEFKMVFMKSLKHVLRK
jgi:hypothetical protein